MTMLYSAYQEAKENFKYSPQIEESKKSKELEDFVI